VQVLGKHQTTVLDQNWGQVASKTSYFHPNTHNTEFSTLRSFPQTEHRSARAIRGTTSQPELSGIRCSSRPRPLETEICDLSLRRPFGLLHCVLDRLTSSPTSREPSAIPNLHTIPYYTTPHPLRQIWSRKEPTIDRAGPTSQEPSFEILVVVSSAQDTKVLQSSNLREAAERSWLEIIVQLVN
jgi:hypothetical protein